MKSSSVSLAHELVERSDVVLDAEFPHPRRQATPVGLTLSANQVWMGRAEDDINRAFGRERMIPGMASITVSIPLLGDSRPNVRMTVFPLNPNLVFA